LTLVVVAGLTAGAAALRAAPLPSAPACPAFAAGNNGSHWYLSGVSNQRFSDDDLRTLNRVTGRDPGRSTPAAS
jgi:hypothetical protein